MMNRPGYKHRKGKAVRSDADTLLENKCLQVSAHICCYLRLPTTAAALQFPM